MSEFEIDVTRLKYLLEELNIDASYWGSQASEFIGTIQGNYIQLIVIAKENCADVEVQDSYICVKEVPDDPPRGGYLVK